MAECTRNEFKDRLPDYVHGTLAARSRAEVDAHLASCASCRAELALLTAARDAIVRRTPKVNVARISAEVRRAGAPSHGSVARSSRKLAWQAAAAILIIGAALYAGYTLRGKPAVERTPSVASLPSSSPSPTPSLTPSITPSPTPSPSHPIVVASKPTLTFGGVDDLTPAQAAAMMKELDQAAPTLEVTPEAEIAMEISS